MLTTLINNHGDNTATCNLLQGSSKFKHGISTYTYDNQKSIHSSIIFFSIKHMNIIKTAGNETNLM